jgi:hypothetical protein
MQRQRLRVRALGAAAALLCCPSLAGAESFDLNVNGDAVRAALSGPLSRLFATSKGEYDAGALFRSEEGADLTQLHAGFLLSGDAGAPDTELTAGLGVRAQYTDLENDSGGGFALGGRFDLRFKGFERLALQGYGYYQPEVLGLGDLEDQSEWALSAGYEVLRDASLYLGYRELRTQVSGSRSVTADDGAHFGVRFQF